MPLRTVLRGERGGNTPDLPGMLNNISKMIKIIVILLFLIPSIASANERILFQRLGYSNGLLFTINPEGSEEQILDDNAYRFFVSPNSQWLLVFGKTSPESENLDMKARLYNLEKGLLYFKRFPAANWWDCWWSEDSKTIYVRRDLNRMNQATNNWSDIIKFQLIAYHVDSGKMQVVKSFDVESPCESDRAYDDIKNVMKKVKPDVRTEFISPDKNTVLFWDEYDETSFYHYGNVVWGKLFLLNHQNSRKVMVFQEKRQDFSANITVTTLTWSPDSIYFAIGFRRGGLFRELWWEFRENLRNMFGKTKSRDSIYILDKDNKSWRKLANGSSPYWFKNFPNRFEELSEKVIEVVDDNKVNGITH